MCMAFATAGIIVAAVPALQMAWTPQAPLIVMMVMGAKSGQNLMVLLAGIAFSYVIVRMLGVSKAQEKPDKRAVGLVLSRFVLFGAIAYCFISGMPDWSWQGRGATWIMQNLLVLFVFGMTVYRQLRTNGKVTLAEKWVFYAMAAMSIVLPALFPSFTFGGGTVRMLLDDIVLSWPVLVAGTVLAMIWVVLLYHALDDAQQAEDASGDLLVVLALLGTAWLLKFVLMNPVIGSPVVVLVFWYGAIVLANRTNELDTVRDVPLKCSPLLWQALKLLGISGWR